MTELQLKILSYLKSNGNSNCLDVREYTQVRIDIVLSALGKLEKANKIRLVYSGLHTWYEVI